MPIMYLSILIEITAQSCKMIIGTTALSRLDVDGASKEFVTITRYSKMCIIAGLVSGHTNRFCRMNKSSAYKNVWFDRQPMRNSITNYIATKSSDQFIAHSNVLTGRMNPHE